MKQDLFREVTRRICGSLNIDEALYDVFLYLKKELPLDSILLTEYDHKIKITRLVAFAYNKGGFLMDELVPLSEITWDLIGKWQVESIAKTNPWIRDHTHPINREILKIGRRFYPDLYDRFTENYCSITCALKIKNRILGNLTFVSEGSGHYNQSHAKLIEEVNEPFAIALSNALRYMGLVRDHIALQKDAQKLRGDVMIGADAGLREIKKLMEAVAPTDSPVLLLGQTGTGKEVVANEIHKLSLRSQGPMVTLNCGAIPESLIDSELFGHEKGAFTGAIKTNIGRFERANGGTLFLDEIGELPQTAQVKLLRVLQTGEFERVGGHQAISSNARIIAATHRDLNKMINNGQFRSDLWYRLNVFPMHIPPLRERKQDIPALVDYFIGKKCDEMNLAYRPPLAHDAITVLQAYDWPGNVRELQNIVERSLILSSGRALNFNGLSNNLILSNSPESPPGQQLVHLDVTIKQQIQLAIEQAWGKISGPGGAAELLGMNPNTLRSKMKKHGIKGIRNT